MDSMRKNAIITGVLFILGFAGVITAVITKPILDSSDYFMKISANENAITAGAFCTHHGFACAGIAIALYPVLKKYSEGLALGSVGFRIIEAILEISSAIGLILLLALSQEFVKAGAPASSHFQTIGAIFISVREWVGNIYLIPWCIGDLMYYFMFYQTRLIPRWLSGWGLAAAAVCLASSFLVMFRVISPFGVIQIFTNAPIGLQELVLAVWLIIKGFNPSAIASLSARKIYTGSLQAIK